MANTVISWKTPLKGLDVHTHISFYSKQHTYYLMPVKYSFFTSLLNYYYTLYGQYQENPTPELKEEMAIVSARMTEMADEISVNKDYPARLLVDLGASYTIENLELTFDVHNLFNHKYSQSGMSTGLIPQKGLWFMGTVAYKF